MAKRKWDLTSVRSLDAAAEWLRKESGGIVVMVIRGEDVAFAVDLQVSPSDAATMVEVAMPELREKLERIRNEAKHKRLAKAGVA